jgi:hypothetical protein
MKWQAALVATTLVVAGSGLHAQDWRPTSAFIAQGGVTAHGNYSVTAGVSWPWNWQRHGGRGEWSGYTEVFASHWNSKVSGGHMSFTQLGAVPVFRYRFAEGRSPWFLEGGIGVSYMDRLYQRGPKRFSTQWNFYDTVGVGRSFGARNEHEIALRLSHISNAGFKEPNPGENFLQLRYARHF